MDNCGYWLYLGSGNVPKIEGSIKHIAVDFEDSGSWDCGGRPVLDWGANPLSEYTESHSVPRILTRAEKGQALTHLEMDFNLASLFHKVNTSSVSHSFDVEEFTDYVPEPSKIPYKKFTATGTFRNYGLEMDLDTSSFDDDRAWGTGKSVDSYGPYECPKSYSVSPYYVKDGDTYTKKNSVPTASMTPLSSGSCVFEYFKELDFDPAEGIYPELLAGETFYTKKVVGNVVTYEAFVSLGPEAYRHESVDPDGKDTYYNVHKPSRKQERAGLFATFSYAPVKNGKDTIIQNPFQTIKVQHTTDEIRYKLANEQIPGTFQIRENFYVTGSTHVKGNISTLGSVFVSESLHVSGSSYIESDSFFRGSATIDKNLLVGGKATVDQDLAVKGNVSCSQVIEGNNLLIHDSGSFGNGIRVTGHSEFHNNGGEAIEVWGDVYVHGVIRGNLYDTRYNSVENPNYATQYSRFGTVDTGSQSDKRLKKNPLPIFDPLYKLDQIQGYEFNWAEEAEKSGHDVGLIAQELQTVYPVAVAEGQDGYLRIDYEKLVPLLVAAIKELRCQVKELQGLR